MRTLEPDQMPRSLGSGLGLQCLPLSLFTAGKQSVVHVICVYVKCVSVRTVVGKADHEILI